MHERTAPAPPAEPPDADHVVDLPARGGAAVAAALADFLLACLDAEAAVD